MSRRSMRSIQAAINRRERDARKRAREAEKAWAAAQKAAHAEAARLEVAASEAHLEELTSIHREALDPVSWRALAERAAPRKPTGPLAVDRRRSEAAKARLSGYRPTFFERFCSGARAARSSWSCGWPRRSQPRRPRRSRPANDTSTP